MELDEQTCEQARLNRDARFDGRFFIGVTSTGIYCRPICPTPHAKRAHVRYFPSAAAAAEAGFRPCLRCRPEVAPGTPAWNGTSATVSRGLRLIAEGALDEDGVETLAGRLGVSSRHLSRLFLRHLGALPVAVAQTRRLHFAKQLISDTDLPMGQVALASGFRSIRRFNDVFHKLYGRTPSELRRLNRGLRPRAEEGEYVFRLAYRPPYDWASLMAFLAARATPGVEAVTGGTYRRSILFHGHPGILEVGPVAGAHALQARIRFPEPVCLLQIVTKVRAMFDLAADPEVISRHLGNDPLLAPLVRRFPGLRVPGAWDGFELCVRAILGQQISMSDATTLSGRLVERFGEPLAFSDSSGLTHIFPQAARLANAGLSGMSPCRLRVIRALAEKMVENEIPGSGAPPEKLLVQLMGIEGMDEWVVQYVTLRALNDPDAFPASDRMLRRVAGAGQSLTPRTLLRYAEAWKPWRAYAAMYLWRAAADTSVKAPTSVRRALTIS